MSNLAREFAFTQHDFDDLRGLAARRTGIVLGEDKFNMVYSRLARRLRTLRLDSFADYRQHLRRHEDTEIVELVNALTTNLTSFFREKHHFDYLREQLLPKLVERNHARKRLRIWSAGCSTGEEPYSVAMALAESAFDLHDWDVRILATDIDSNVLAQGANAVYAQERLESVPNDLAKRWFRRGRGANIGKVRVVDDLRRLVHYKQLNLLDPWPVKGPFDAIFCRNVIIYFDKATKKHIVEQFAGLLHEDARLFLGHSESLLQVTDRLVCEGHTTYRKADLP